MTTLVIGGAGFVGLNIVERLLTAGESVVAFDVEPPHPAAAAHVATLPGSLSVVTGDVRDAASLAPAFAEAPSALVYGAAVTAGADRDKADPERTLAVNLTGFLDALRAAHAAGVGRVINLSSSAAYGDAAFGEGVLMEETSPSAPKSIYAITKYASELMADRMAEMWAMDVVNVRLTGVFGRWERQTGVRDTPSPHFQTMRAALAGEPALFERRDCRDWIYAPDVARAIHQLLTAPKLTHRFFHISTGSPWSAADWGAELARLRPGLVARVAKPGEAPTISLHAPIDRKPMSIQRLQDEIGFAPEFDLVSSAADYDAWVRGPGASYP